jgi:hypothetical protein
MNTETELNRRCTGLAKAMPSRLALPTQTQASTFLSPEEIGVVLQKARQRVATTIPSNLLEQLNQELRQTRLAVLVQRGCLSVPTTLSAVELFRHVVYQEAGFFYNAVPFPTTKGMHVDLSVSIDSQELQNLARGRISFKTHYPALHALAQTEWDHMPPELLPEVQFGCATDRPRVSLCIPCLSWRVEGLAKRLPVLVQSYSATDIEVILTIADPQHLDTAAREYLYDAARATRCPVKIVWNPGVNRIGTNRNLAFRKAGGRYCIFLDDDVRFVGRAIDLLVETLTHYPEIGLVSLPSHDVLDTTHPRWSKPRWHNLKVRAQDPPGLVIVNLVPGMVMATHRELAQILPFPTFWPNTGEDYFFSEQINRLGFLNAYVMSDFCWAEHIDDGSPSASGSSGALADFLCSACLNYYFLPETFDCLREGVTLHGLKKQLGDCLSWEQTQQFWHAFRSRAVNLLNGDQEAFRDWETSTLPEEARVKESSIAAVIDYLETKRSAIVAFKHTELKMKDLARLRNSYLGPLNYTAATPTTRVST